MREITVKLYKFDELPTEQAKDKARQWFRESNNEDSFWSEAVTEDAQQCFKLCGFTIDKVYWSGFSSQGDGACFEGRWKAEDVKPGALKAHAPQDKELHHIAAALEGLAKKWPTMGMTVKHRGHYYHEHCTEFSVYDNPENIGEEELDEKAVESIEELSKDAMCWIYKMLEQAYDFENEDSTIEENLRANNYEFTKDGKLA